MIAVFSSTAETPVLPSGPRASGRRTEIAGKTIARLGVTVTLSSSEGGETEGGAKVLSMPLLRSSRYCAPGLLPGFLNPGAQPLGMARGRFWRPLLPGQQVRRPMHPLAH